MKRVVIVQPYVPSYRVPLFTRLQARLLEKGVELVVAHGRPAKSQAARNDAVTLPFSEVVRTLQIYILGRHIRWKSVGRLVRCSDLVISELASGALENYWLAIRPHTRHGLWGHGFATTSGPNKLDSMLERWLMRRSDHTFFYTDKGGVVGAAAGLEPGKVTVLNNTVDTGGLAEAIKNVTAEEIEEFRSTYDLGAGPCCAFVGGLDASKRIEFLLLAGARLAQLVPGFQLIIAGDGAARQEVVDAARDAAWLRYVGRVGDQQKAMIAATCALLLNPGRVGLIAVDSFVMETPLVTTDWPFHGPEYDYLVHGESAVVTGNSLGEFVAGVAATLDSPTTQRELVAGCRESATLYSLDAMVDRFLDGITQSLSAPPGS